LSKPSERPDEASAQSICQSILRKIKPSDEEKETVLKLAEDVRARVEREAHTFSLAAEVRIEGSVAKDTWLRGEADVDIFMLLPPEIPREELEEKSLGAARKSVARWGWTERFAEHPYIETFIDGVRVNIVPCYKVLSGQWKSATDRTPFHTKYVNEHLKGEEQKDEVRLIKKFMKGIGAYGAEIKIRGFSGYLCELLIIKFGSFLKTLESAGRWKANELIDLQGYYKGREDEAEKMFGGGLMVVDPVDRARNVAAAVDRDRYYEFISASRAFLAKPSQTFFDPQHLTPIAEPELRGSLASRGTDLIFVKFESRLMVPDILWGQLHKSLRSIEGLLDRHDFKVIRSSAWSDEKRHNILVLEVEQERLAPSKKRLGPPVAKGEDENFLKKYREPGATISGPWIHEGRWIALVKRGHQSAVDLIKERLENGGRDIGVGKMIAEDVRKTTQILANDEIRTFYRSNKGFAEFLTKYLKGKPAWL